MAITHDAHTESATFTTTSPFLGLVHSGATTSKCALLAIYHGTVSTDLITGAVTYGGIPMHRVATAVDTGTETGRVYIYFLDDLRKTTGNGISIAHTGSTDVKIAAVSTFNSDVNLGFAIADVQTIDQDAANPQVTLYPSKGYRGFTPPAEHAYAPQMCFCVLYTGTAGPVSPGAVPTAVILGTMTALSENDFGNFAGGVARQTTAARGPFTIGYTSALDDVAFAAVSIQEVSRYDDFTFPMPELDSAAEIYIPPAVVGGQFILVNTAAGLR